MKAIIVMLLLLPLGGGMAQEKKEARKAEPKKASAPLTIPAGAKEVEANTYRYTDSKGKTWIYRRTPFGVTRFEDKPEGKTADSSPALMVTEIGDNLRFERQTPFGKSTWVRKKSELNKEERAAWERSREQKAGGK